MHCKGQSIWELDSKFLSLVSGMCVHWVPCTWDLLAHPWIATITLNLCSMTTGRWRGKRNLEVTLCSNCINYNAYTYTLPIESGFNFCSYTVEWAYSEIAKKYHKWNFDNFRSLFTFESLNKILRHLRLEMEKLDIFNSEYSSTVCFPNELSTL